ncbi:MAG TPA: 50S ribosomal protein L1 [Dehalococcoidia bacterium]|jgi:large subunit ribosomal protein L1|nr:50S ribosomal protein L1 [Dehalococcoidia bacterium]
MPKVGKRVTALRERVDIDKLYGPTEAVALVKETATAKFDETIELHLNTGLDGRHADQQIRGSVVMPHGLGRTMRVAVFAEGEAATFAEQAGADVVGGDDLVARMEGGEMDFDVVLAQREMMGKVGRLGRVLGPRGLMPNPRANTVLEADDITRAVGEAKAGRAEFRLDRTNLVHCAIGKASFSEGDLTDNLTSLIDEIVKAKPAGAKGQYIRAATLSSTMGAGIHLEVAPLLELASGS